MLLMLLGTQWYILFNVIAGAMAIPTDLREASSVFHFNRWQRWSTVILPGIFPYLVTGLVTASGGAWNASIVAEYFHFKRQTLSTTGLGAQITPPAKPAISSVAAFHHRDGGDGSLHQPRAVAAYVPSCRNQIPARNLGCYNSGGADNCSDLRHSQPPMGVQIVSPGLDRRSTGTMAMQTETSQPASSQPASSARDFLRAKTEGRKLSMVTCYDYTFARLFRKSASTASWSATARRWSCTATLPLCTPIVDLMRLHTEAVARGARRQIHRCRHAVSLVPQRRGRGARRRPCPDDRRRACGEARRRRWPRGRDRAPGRRAASR